MKISKVNRKSVTSNVVTHQSVLVTSYLHLQRSSK